MTAPTDAEITARLAAGPSRRWEELFALAGRLGPAERHVRWQPPRDRGDGVVQVGYPVYDETVQAVRALLAELGAVVVFDWAAWDGARRYPGGEGLAEAPVAEAARLATTIIRGERFCDGTIAGALADGTLPAILRRLHAWYVRERAPGG